MGIGGWLRIGTVGVVMLTGQARAEDELVARGRYLATVGDCVACHTAPSGQPFAGGLYMPTPFGDISTPNITPDPTTGIGSWTDDQFYRAMREGIGKDGEYLYPVFPFPWFTKVTRADVQAIKAYLFSLAPVVAPRKPLRLGFPFNIRAGLAAWRAAFFKPGEFVPSPEQGELVDRGAYLVEGLGHCGECHNRNAMFGASAWSGRLKGGEIEGWYAPTLRADGRNGLGSWSEDQIATYLKTGTAPGKGVALGPMQETIEASLSHLSTDDLRAMAAYLKSQANGGGETAPAVATAEAGAQAFLSHCAFCHGADGRGTSGMVPPLAGNGAVQAKGPENIIRVVLGGLAASHDMGPMPAVGAGMSDADVAAVANYVRTAWGNDAPADTGTGSVAELREATSTMLAGNLAEGCPALPDPHFAAAAAGLAGAQSPDLLDRIQATLPPLRAAGLADDEIVNGLTAAYCATVLDGAGGDQALRASRLGNFAVLVYSQLKQAGPRP